MGGGHVAATVFLLLCCRSLIFTILAILELKRHSPDAKVTTFPLVSVVIPAFNEAAVISRTLDSLLACDYANKEIIVVDDGSCDGTRRVVEEYRDRFSSLTILAHSENLGKAAALNTGIAVTTGALVATIDADTEVRADTLSRCVRRLSVSGEIAVACNILVSRPHKLLEEIQDQEYRTGLNIERAAQSRLRAISVLPGAATVFRGSVARAYPFSGRTRTEDADHTLWLSSLGHSAGYAMDAIAETQVPATCSALARQRIRWIGGHLQCSIYHAASLLRTARFTFVTFPIFVILNFAGFAALISGAYLGVIGQLGSVRVDPVQMFLASLGLIYCQRFAVIYALNNQFPRLRTFLLEPLFMPLVHAYAFVSFFFDIALRSAGMSARKAPGISRTHTPAG